MVGESQNCPLKHVKQEVLPSKTTRLIGLGSVHPKMHIMNHPLDLNFSRVIH